MVSEPPSAASPVAAAAETEDPTPANSRPRRENRATRRSPEEEEMEVRRRALVTEAKERGLGREREIRSGNCAISAVDSIADSGAVISRRVCPRTQELGLIRLSLSSFIMGPLVSEQKCVKWYFAVHMKLYKN
jgi:hypothetical protein